MKTNKHQFDRKGFLIPLIVVTIALVFILIIAYQSHVRQEALRAHRTYWNEVLVKSAEGVSEEAFRWLIDNPTNPKNLIFKRITNTNPSAAKTVKMTLTERELPFIEKLRETYEGQSPIRRVNLTLSGIKPIFKPTAVPPPNFNPHQQGIIYPDHTDLMGLLSVEIEGNYRGLQRRLIIVKDLKAINILPGPLGKFTLFVKEKKSGANFDWNKLETVVDVRHRSFNSYGFIVEDPNKLNNPITLIHSKDDLNRNVGIHEIPEGSVAPPIPDALANADLTKRGWVYMGRNTENGPLQYYVFQPMQGEVRVAANHSNLPNNLRNKFHRFYGGSFMLSDREKLYYLLRDQDGTMPEFASFFPNKGGINLTPSYLIDNNNRKVDGWMLWQTRAGYMSLTKEVLQQASLYHLFRNYYEHPVHNLGVSNYSDESPHASIILPMGDMYPTSASNVADRRSPTIMLGAWLRFMQIGNTAQVDDDIKAALGQNPPGDWLAALRSSNNTNKPRTFYAPYFPITVNEATNPHSIKYDSANDKLGLTYYQNWGRVNDNISSLNPDFAKVSYNVYSHILKKLGQPISTYEIVMSKMLLYPGMMIYEQLANDNMRNAIISLFVPGGKTPGDPQQKLVNLPNELSEVLQTTDPRDGAPVSSKGIGFGKELFYKSPDESRECYGISGECISLKSKDGRQLALGSLGVLWPFSQDYSLLASDEQNSAYDLRHKATFLANSSKEFEKAFLKVKNGKTILDLKGGVVCIQHGDLQLKALVGNEIKIKKGGMIIASEGEIFVHSPLKLEDSLDSLVVATAKTDRDIHLNPGNYEAYFISSGTLRRIQGGAINIIGGLAVDHLDFTSASSSIFYGMPSSNSTRQTIVYDDKFNIIEPDKYNAGVRVHLGKSMVYWTEEKI